MKPGVPAFELEHCREAALLPGGLFEFTSRFLRAEEFEAYLSLYAIIRLIQSIPAASFDESIKWAKLQWWGDELAADPGATSRHPVLRVLWASGARAKLDAALLRRLVTDAMMQMDRTPDVDKKAMFKRLAASGSATIELELALTGAELDEQSLMLLAAASGMSALLAGFSALAQRATGQPKLGQQGLEQHGPHEYGFDQIPMNILAKYSLNSAQLAQHRQAFTGILSDLADEGLDWFSRGLRNLDGSARNRAGKHLQLRWAMEKRGLANIRKNGAGYLDRRHRYGPADVWFAWCFMRRIDQ